MKSVAFFLLFSLAQLQAQNIPAKGTAASLDIGTWNTEWLGSSSSGPTNDKLQLSNVLKVLKGADMDVWGLCEVSTMAVWDSLKTNLPDYQGAISTWDQTQKTALLFKKSVFKLLYQRHILAVYDYDFASGRLPLEVALEYKDVSITDTFYFYVLHLKANTGSTSEKLSAYNRRKNASEALKTYLDANKNRKAIVLGDWNDDLDVSIYNSLATPFAKMVNDTAGYLFPTYQLSLNGDRSTASYTQMIDHICVNGRMKPYYIYESSDVYYLNSLIVSYASTTSDHYPVFARFDLERKVSDVKTVQLQPIVTVSGNILSIKSQVKEYTFSIYDFNGRLIEKGKGDSELNIRSGNYVIHFSDGNQYFVQKVIIP